MSGSPVCPRRGTRVGTSCTTVVAEIEGNISGLLGQRFRLSDYAFPSIDEGIFHCVQNLKEGRVSIKNSANLAECQKLPEPQRQKVNTRFCSNMFKTHSILLKLKENHLVSLSLSTISKPSIQ